MTTATELRQLFLLRDDVVFLNHGSFGACPRPVFDTYQALQRELEAEPVDFLHAERTLPAPHGRRARRVWRAFVGADRDDLVFVPNATTGLNIVARSLPLRRRATRCSTTDHEYGAMDRTWPFVCEQTRRRATCARALPLPLDDPPAVVEAVWSRRDGAHAGALPQPHHLDRRRWSCRSAELVRGARERGHPHGRSTAPTRPARSTWT